ncbi:uncharacterized protein LOC117818380 isoform X2 [Notolabrus celidotus]|uniref:uncharacterized protein LOC117818380 isoform X2 n=1 Tax=Notolabrus celidotus TaxID=1203425 RepID=UPI0014905E36|nr:uncharacterized protein LOC117818380 isoform X2 [Notolabrus celidotus]
MSSIESLRSFVLERLTAAAEEIFGAFKRTIVEYEEEIDRQRRLLDNVWTPGINKHGTELPLQPICKEENNVSDQQLCYQERNSSPDLKDPEPPKIKEEQEDVCSSQEEEQLELKQEIDTFIYTPAFEGSVDTEPELKNNQQPLSRSVHDAESQHHSEEKQDESDSTDKLSESMTHDHSLKSDSDDSQSPSLSEIHSNTRKDNDLLNLWNVRITVSAHPHTYMKIHIHIHFKC